MDCSVLLKSKTKIFERKVERRKGGTNIHSTRVVAVWQGDSQQTMTKSKAGGSNVEEEGGGTEKSWLGSFGC